MNYKQVFRDHPINLAFKEINDLIDKIVWDIPEYKNSDELLKLKYSFEYIKKCVSNANVYITNISTLDNINASLNNLKASISAFIQNTGIGLEKSVTIIEGALTYTSDVIQKNNSTKTVVEIDSIDIFNKLQKSMEASINYYNKELNKFDEKSKSIIDDLSDASDNLETTKQRVESFLVNLQTSYNSSEADRTKQFSTLLEKFTKINDDKINEELEDFNLQKDSFLKDAEELIEELTSKRDQAAKLLQIITNTGFAGNYSKNADYERDTANTMRWISIATFSLISGLAIWILFSFQSNGSNWQNSFIKILATTLLSGLATYTTRESGKHRKLERKYRKMELELSSIDAFIETLPVEERNNLKIEITRKLFESEIDDENENKVEKKEDENLITTSLLQNFMKIFEDTIKNLSKK